jgi:uncharacterized protein (DUF2252 family)
MAHQRRIAERLKTFNQDREPVRLAMKYKAMNKDAFAFLRGSCHLFYEDWLRDSPLDTTPAAWICGDLHLENFGCYKGDNRLVYFDINDFDESVLAPAAWDLARFLTSVWVAGDTLELDTPQTKDLCQVFLNAYTAELLGGKARWIERATAKGMIHDLLKDLKNRSRQEFIATRTEHGGKSLRIDGKRTLEADDKNKDKVKSLLDRFAQTKQPPHFFNILSIARRIAGIGSLGLERYVILVEGKGGADGHYLLDLKYQPDSSLRPHVPLPQPVWESEANRVVALQTRGQAIAPAFLAPVIYEGKAYVLRELMPTTDSLCLAGREDKPSRLEKVLNAMGKLVAWSHLRGSGRQGSAIADEWIQFAQRDDWRNPLLDYARVYALQVRKDWKEFTVAYGHGELGD